MSHESNYIHVMYNPEAHKKLCTLHLNPDLT